MQQKSVLSETDYEVIKQAEGAIASISDELKKERAEARAIINADQAEIEKLTAEVLKEMLEQQDAHPIIPDTTDKSIS